jgi:glycosyltransferase involved in cell wall biosynthesis
VDAIVTDSQFSRQDIEKYLHVEHRKIKVIDLAADPSFNSNVDRSELDYVKRKYSLPEKFILYVGGFDLRKNVGVMLRAYASLRNQDLIEHKLMLAGRFQPSAKQLRLSLVSDVPRLIRELRMGNDVKLMGFVPQSDLPALYRLASLFVYPSLYEGFGLPVLEAMTCGTPTLASERSSIPEILNREDLLFNPEDVELIQQKMLRVLSDPRLMEEISQWVKKRAKDFSWMRTAQETMDLYAALVGSEPKLDTN